jgi:uncharacterized protein YjeT (DUF2065 family)
MSVKNLFIATGIVTLFFGIMLMFFPEHLGKMVLTDPTMTANNIALARNYGVVLVAIGIGVLAARNSIPSAARRGYVIQITISGLVLAGYDIHDILSGVCKPAEWGVVVIVGILGLWGLAKLLQERSAAL